MYKLRTKLLTIKLIVKLLAHVLTRIPVMILVINEMCIKLHFLKQTYLLEIPAYKNKIYTCLKKPEYIYAVYNMDISAR